MRRRVGRGMARLEEHRHLLTSFDPDKRNAGLFAGYLAQSVDMWLRQRLHKEITALFSNSVRSRMPLHDYLHLRMAEGMVAMAEESKDEAIQHFDLSWVWTRRQTTKNYWPLLISGRAAACA